jgi:hypothetical protein
MTQAVERITLVILLALVATPAQAGRWRKGARPAGTTYTQRQTVDGRWCHYRDDETGTNECRWKTSAAGCRWYYDAGVNQCSPTPAIPTPTTAATLTATNGTITITPTEDGDSNPETMSGTITVTKASTGEVVTGKIRLRVPSDARALTRLSQGNVALRTTPLQVLPGSTTYRPINRTPTGWQLGGTPAPVPLPGAPVPGGGSTCGIAWTDYVSQQLNCFGDAFGPAVYNAFTDGAWAAYYNGVNCGMLGARNESLAMFAQCLGQAAGGAFVYGFVHHVFGDAMPVTANCNGVAQARMQTSYYCDPKW